MKTQESIKENTRVNTSSEQGVPRSRFRGPRRAFGITRKTRLEPRPGRGETMPIVRIAVNDVKGLRAPARTHDSTLWRTRRDFFRSSKQRRLPGIGIGIARLRRRQCDCSHRHRLSVLINPWAAVQARPRARPRRPHKPLPLPLCFLKTVALLILDSTDWLFWR